MNARDLAKLIFTDEPIIVPKNKAYMNKMKKLVLGIYSNEETRNDRTIRQIWRDSRKSAPAEIAMCILNKDFIMNPLNHDKTNPHSFAYDNIYLPTKQTIEVKSHPEDNAEMTIAEWFSYAIKALKTFRKHQKLVNFVVSAKVVSRTDHFEVYFVAIMDAKSFFHYAKNSNYNNVDLVYYHHNAIRDGACVKNTRIKYRGDPKYARSKRASFRTRAA